MSMKFIDLFSGIGGFRIALERLGNDCVFSADFDENACATYEMNFGDFPQVDITTLRTEDIPEHEILCAGFPCQPFSIAGFRKGFEDTRGTLFFDLLRVIRAHQPKIFVLENVKGLVNHDGGKTFEHMLQCLAETVNGSKKETKTIDNLGYHVFWAVLNSSSYGVPQNRERVFIVGFKDYPNKFKFPNKLEQKARLEDILDNQLETSVEPHRLSDQSVQYVQKYLKMHPKFEQIKDLNHLIAFEIRKSRTNFRYDNLSPCLTTKMGTGGNNVPFLVNQSRFLSISELLKIQGFPTDFRITPKRSYALRQIGNSVSVPVVEAVLKEATLDFA